MHIAQCTYMLYFYTRPIPFPYSCSYHYIIFSLLCCIQGTLHLLQLFINYLLTYDSYGPVHNRFHRGEWITWASGGEGALDIPVPLNGRERSEWPSLTPLLCQWACMTFSTKDGGGELHPPPPRQQAGQVIAQKKRPIRHSGRAVYLYSTGH
jgi:hypothetical protein